MTIQFCLPLDGPPPPQKICSILTFTSWIKLIFDTVTLSNFVINEFNPTFEVHESENRALQNQVPQFQMVNFDMSLVNLH